MGRGTEGMVLRERAQREKPRKLRETTSSVFKTLNTITVFLLAEQLRLNLNRIWGHHNNLVMKKEKPANLWYLNIKYMRYIENLIPFHKNNSHQPKPRRRRRRKQPHSSM